MYLKNVSRIVESLSCAMKKFLSLLLGNIIMAEIN